MHATEFLGAVPPEHYKEAISAMSRIPQDQADALSIGPVASWKKGTPYRRMSDTWSPDPKRQTTHERCLHYTKGWRYRRKISA